MAQGEGKEKRSGVIRRNMRRKRRIMIRITPATTKA